MKRTGYTAVLIAAATALAGCAGAEPDTGAGAPGTADVLSGRAFVSTEVTEAGAPRSMADGTKVSLRFTEDGRILADAGCNTLQGPVRLSAGKLGVSDLSMTEIGCDPARHEQDTWLADFLGKAPLAKVDDTTLTLTAGDTSMVLVDREVAQPDMSLDNTTWTVDTLVTGETASSVPAGATATIRFVGDRAEVNTGCNTGSAVVKADATTLTFAELAITRMACEAPLMDLENAVVAVLDGETTFGIDADRLTIDHPSGAGLQLRATS